ncbi:MAG: phospholipid scramblase-related protein [Acidimicrobiales bacterium]|nr:phospholipid scramblase-related protein [Acidimicrobiales bacterium]
MPGTSILNQQVLLVNQKAKFIELTNEYKVSDGDGNPVGSVVQVGQSKARKVLRFVSNVDQFLTHKLEVREADGTVALRLTRPAKIMKSTVVVESADGKEIGKIRQQNVIGKINFAFEVGERQIGSIQAENWRAWNFAVVDETGTEVARITKKWEGVVKATFTTADNYFVQIHKPLTDPLRALVIAAALCVDTALKQDDK